MLHDKVEVVTGGADGIGAATARILAREGAAVAAGELEQTSERRRGSDRIVIRIDPGRKPQSGGVAFEKCLTVAGGAFLARTGCPVDGSRRDQPPKRFGILNEEDHRVDVPVDQSMHGVGLRRT